MIDIVAKTLKFFIGDGQTRLAQPDLGGVVHFQHWMSASLLDS
jgi:hypothetical protein